MKILVGGAWPCCSILFCLLLGQGPGLAWAGQHMDGQNRPLGVFHPTPEPLFERLDTQTIGRSLPVKKAP